MMFYLKGVSSIGVLVQVFTKTAFYYKFFFQNLPKSECPFFKWPKTAPKSHELFFKRLTKGSRKKILLLMAGPLRGGGGKGPAIKEKN